MNYQSLLNWIIRLVDIRSMKLGLVLRLNIPETCMLIEMSSESISCMVKHLISSTNEASSLDNIMSIIKSWSGKIFINRMDLKAFKRINGSDCMLPDISHNIVEAILVKHVDWVGWKPVLQIKISNLFVLPGV